MELLTCHPAYPLKFLKWATEMELLTFNPPSYILNLLTT